MESHRWQLRDAEARFSEMLEACLSEGPQIVTANGKDCAVLVPIQQWHRLQRMTKPNLKDWLLARRLGLKHSPRPGRSSAANRR